MFEAVILGIIQGLTEYIPVSSTAHLILVSKLFGGGNFLDTLTFDVALHVGTLFAVVAYFFRDWVRMLTTERKTLMLIIVASIPAGIAGFFLDHFAEEHLRSPIIISISLVGVAVLMWLSERLYRAHRNGGPDMKDSLFMGFAQALAIIPGVSRSGITISAGLTRNLTREAAARFSFLMSTPIIAGAAMLHIMKLFRHGGGSDLHLVAAGVVSSAIAGFFAIKFLMGYFRKYSLDLFVYYRVILGVLILATVWLKA